MNPKHLAIATVPVQEWGATYEPDQALRQGTIFPDLNLPFYAAEKLHCPGRAQDPESQEGMLARVQAVSFVIDDLRLYLDTHPQDLQGLSLLKEMLQKRKKLTQEYAGKFYPLTMDCMAALYEENPGTDCYCWEKGPSPWEGGAAYVGL